MVTPNEKKNEKRKKKTEAQEQDVTANTQPAEESSAVQEDTKPSDEAAKAQDNEFASFEKALENLVAERDSYLDMARRLQADFENYKKRTASVRAEAYLEGKREVCAAMLPVVDNMERAVEASGQEGPVAEGVMLVLKQFRSALETFGVCEIPACGEPFDPNLHHAVMQTEKEGTEEGTVVDVLQKGYAIDDSVLRYAMVTVSK
ncbi:MAG: nucleotide exchange factor GrpE [Christensenellales bacterium]|jgi:molecular chaperone GrpE